MQLNIVLTNNGLVDSQVSLFNLSNNLDLIAPSWFFNISDWNAILALPSHGHTYNIRLRYNNGLPQFDSFFTDANVQNWSTFISLFNLNFNLFNLTGSGGSDSNPEFTVVSTNTNYPIAIEVYIDGSGTPTYIYLPVISTVVVSSAISGQTYSGVKNTLQQVKYLVNRIYMYSTSPNFNGGRITVQYSDANGTANIFPVTTKVDPYQFNRIIDAKLPTPIVLDGASQINVIVLANSMIKLYLDVEEIDPADNITNEAWGMSVQKVKFPHLNVLAPKEETKVTLIFS